MVPSGLERLICAQTGYGEVEKYLDALRKGASYYLDPLPLQRLRQGIYVTVTSDQRVLSTIPKVFSSQKYLLSPYSALAYAGLQDYRVRTGESRTALILAEKSPVCDPQTMSSALGISEETLKQYLK